MTPAELLAAVRARLRKKYLTAEAAYVAQKTAKKTVNCRHSGRNLNDKIHVCKIVAMGEFEGDERNGAACCWDEKAGLCPLFQLRRSVTQVKSEFLNMDPEERALRWPSLGELLRMESLVKELDGAVEKSDDRSTTKRDDE